VSTFTKGFEFDYMTQRPMYATCPGWLVDHCRIDENSSVVDLGCGSGILTQLLLQRFEHSTRFRVTAIDPSKWELDIARSRVLDERVTFINGRAQEALQIVKESADAVLLCNVLHQIPLVERRPVLEGAFALLRQGGMLGANTLFYNGGITADTRPFYLRLMAEARDSLRRQRVQWNLPTATTVALQRLTPSEHGDLLTEVGFRDVEVEEVPFDWTVEDWEALSKYSVFIQGALAPDIDLEAGSQALIQGARAAYDALGIKTVRRGWLHCAGRHP
jgi:ubiquinone/menaquinone biosynthesis C-methylase UbiE